MSTISLAQKSKTLSILDNRNVSLIILAALVTLLVTVVAVSAASPVTRTFDPHGYQLYRQSEWASEALPAQAYQIFRQGEVASPASRFDGFALYRQGEWISVPVPAVDLSSYLQSERTFTDANAGLTIFHLSERTLTDPQAGMAIYQNSERTRIPAPFTKYQLSEWFGK